LNRRLFAAKVALIRLSLKGQAIAAIPRDIHHSMTETLEQQHPRIESIAAILTDEIARGLYSVGSKFPAEPELQERFGAGRHTVREALKLLTEKGLVGRRKKRGTFVIATKPVSNYVHSLRDLHALDQFAGETRLEIRFVGFVSPTRLMHHTVKPSERWLRIAGVRYTKKDQQPLCWSEIYVPERFAPKREEIRETDRVWDLVRRQNELVLDHVEQEVSATVIPRSIAKVLDAPSNSPGLFISRRYVAEFGETFEISQNLYPAGRGTVRSILRQRA
jgi:DNA-binding GntR family transcriptional regulator